MFESLARYLSEKGSLTGDELKLVEQVCIPKKIRKHQYLLQEGEISHHNNFVVKGCFRLYRIGNDGQEHVMRFAIENWWINDYYSYQSGQPTKCYIDALEHSELLMIEKKDFDGLIEKIPNFKNLIKNLNERNFEVNQDRIFSNISETAEEKYDNFIKTYPTIYKRIPLHMVASFLGVSRETLSRVRKQNTTKRIVVTK